MAFLMFCYSGGVGSTWVLAGDCLRLAFFPSSVHTGAHNAGNKITLDPKASDPAGVQGTVSRSLQSGVGCWYPYWGRSPGHAASRNNCSACLEERVCARTRCVSWKTGRGI
ncbi:hypothetical protein BDP55DRAFT_75696 [Colletotrichum godetiae]|uniref:Uncharacterized protein n=1 Tax=Colletotrichum godetiae TaxID=1209918 RepID=A0AAJ0EVU4_9PEZI|nr:uncharacterized protein BDP55DRAFT_75696 [Colletotrichum godetiae]KAK1688030.1 hypothetical protein BDP55DRAFT_75696 [Colletotrichum godetiae]